MERRKSPTTESPVALNQAKNKKTHTHTPSVDNNKVEPKHPPPALTLTERDWPWQSGYCLISPCADCTPTASDTHSQLLQWSEGPWGENTHRCTLWVKLSQILWWAWEEEAFCVLSASDFSRILKETRTVYLKRGVFGVDRLVFFLKIYYPTSTSWRAQQQWRTSLVFAYSLCKDQFLGVSVL